MGHLTKIANHITHFIDKGNNADRIKEIIKGKSLIKGNHPTWKHGLQSALH